MAPSIIQPYSIILPTIYVLGTETEVIATSSVVVHTSIEFNVEHLQEKTVYVMATEVVAVGAPGNLWAWIETSPVLTATSAVYWSAIGGGGGALNPVTFVPLIPPLVPSIVVGAGTNGLIHAITLNWTIHSGFCRLRVQTPVASATAAWVVQALVAGKAP